MTEQLYRHPTDRAIAGVAGGMAVWLRLDPSLVRVVWVLLAVFSGGLFVLVYLVMMVVVPLPPPGWTPGWRNPGTGSAAWGQAPASGPPPGTWPASGPPPGGRPAADGWPAADGPPAGAPASEWDTPALTPGSAATGAPAPGSPSGSAPASPSWTGPTPGNAGIVAGVVLIVLGAWFLVDQFVRIDWDLLWPVIVIVLGGALIAGALMRSRSG